MANLRLGLRAHWIVNAVGCRPRENRLYSNWQELVRIGITKKIVATHGINTGGLVIGVRKCSEPSNALRKIQSMLIKPKLFIKRKSVVHKPELKKNETLYLPGSPPN